MASGVVEEVSDTYLLIDKLIIENKGDLERKQMNIERCIFMKKRL